MQRIAFVFGVAFCAVVATRGSASADVIVGTPADSSSVVVKTKPPTVVVVRKKEAPRPPAQQPSPRERKVGLHFDVGGTFGRDVSMGGFNGALRIRPTPYFALDLGSGYFAGTDFEGDFRREVPVTANMFFFVNPKSKVQFYVLLGPGASFGKKEPFDEVRDLIHVGGQAGLGLEFRLTPGFALNLDFRGVLRHRVDRDPRPEFVDGTRVSDTSGGALGTFGATFYF